MFDSFLDALIGAIGTGASGVADWLTPAATSATEFTPELAALGTAGTEAAVSTAPSVAADAAPALLQTGTEFGSEMAPTFGPAADATPNMPSEFYSAPTEAVPPAWAPETPAGSVAEPAGPAGFSSAPLSDPTAPPAAPPTAWESVQQIPGKWWQGVQDTPQRAGDYVAQNPFKSLATGAGLGVAAYNAANPPEVPKPPVYNFGPSAAPRVASSARDIPGGPSRSPLLGNRGGMGVKPSTGVKTRGAGGFGV